MDQEKRPQGRCVFSLPPSLAAKAKKGSILYFWQEQLDQLNKNYDDFLAQYAEEHERETSRYFGVGDSVDTPASHESGDDTGNSTSCPEPTDDETLLHLTDNSKTCDAQEQQQLHCNSMLSQLATYKRKTGHCNVPSSNKSHKALGEWVTLQRAKARAGQLSQENIESLETLDFNWVACNMNSQQAEATWYIMFENLKEYKLKTGDCLVPQRYEENIALGMFNVVKNI